MSDEALKRLSVEAGRRHKAAAKRSVRFNAAYSAEALAAKAGLTLQRFNEGF